MLIDFPTIVWGHFIRHSDSLEKFVDTYGSICESVRVALARYEDQAKQRLEQQQQQQQQQQHQQQQHHQQQLQQQQQYGSFPASQTQGGSVLHVGARPMPVGPGHPHPQQQSNSQVHMVNRGQSQAGVPLIPPQAPQNRAYGRPQ